MHHPTPDLYQPRLRWYSHAWRVLVALLVSAGAWGEVVADQWRTERPLFWVDLTLGVVAFVLMFYRRRWPFPIAVVVTLLGFLSASSLGPGALVAVSLATRRRWQEILPVGLLGILVGQTFVVVQPVSGEAWWVTFTTNVSVTVLLFVVGMYVGSRRELLWTLRERAERAEAEQELRVAQARTTERTRIAREMHDVLAHRISLVTMHSGALAYRTDLDREQVTESARIIESNAHQALADLRHVLGVLREDDPDRRVDRPQPTIGDVAELVDEAVRSGMQVDYTAAMDGPEQVPEQVGRTVYRIVREGLTNARKHAPGSRVAVTVSGDPERGVDVEVRNRLRPGSPADTHGAGLGLVGLAERAELAGGRLRTERDAGSFTLHGWLPWQS